jgi:hypothetical protein
MGKFKWSRSTRAGDGAGGSAEADGSGGADKPAGALTAAAASVGKLAATASGAIRGSVSQSVGGLLQGLGRASLHPSELSDSALAEQEAEIEAVLSQLRVTDAGGAPDAAAAVEGAAGSVAAAGTAAPMPSEQQQAVQAGMSALQAIRGLRDVLRRATSGHAPAAASSSQQPGAQGPGTSTAPTVDKAPAAGEAAAALPPPPAAAQLPDGSTSTTQDYLTASVSTAVDALHGFMQATHTHALAAARKVRGVGGETGVQKAAGPPPAGAPATAETAGDGSGPQPASPAGRPVAEGQEEAAGSEASEPQAEVAPVAGPAPAAPAAAAVEPAALTSTDAAGNADKPAATPFQAAADAGPAAPAAAASEAGQGPADPAASAPGPAAQPANARDPNLMVPLLPAGVTYWLLKKFRPPSSSRKPSALARMLGGKPKGDRMSKSGSKSREGAPAPAAGAGPPDAASAPSLGNFLHGLEQGLEAGEKLAGEGDK